MLLKSRVWFIKMKKEKLIQEGLKALLEEKLEILESAIRTKENIVTEVDDYMGAQRIAEKEKLDIEKSKDKYNKLIGQYWEIQWGKAK